MQRKIDSSSKKTRLVSVAKNLTPPLSSTSNSSQNPTTQPKSKEKPKNNDDLKMTNVAELNNAKGSDESDLPKSPKQGLNTIKKFDFTNFNIDKLILKLFMIDSKAPLSSKILLKDLYLLCYRARDIFLHQSTLLKLKSPVVIVGNLEGDYSSLIQILSCAGIPPERSFLFLGNYSGKGKNNLETLCLLLALKIKYPLNFFLLRGGNECMYMNRRNGLYQECRERYKDVILWECFNDVFRMMPYCAVIDQKIFCVHGGITPKLKSFKEIVSIPRLLKPEYPSLAMDLIWSDPDESISRFESNPRGLGCSFGGQVVEEFLEKFNLQLIVRSNQSLQGGYDFLFERKVVSLFSAYHFCNRYKNSAAYLNVNSKLQLSFTVITPTEKRNFNVRSRKT